MGGVLIFTDARAFGLEEQKPMTLKFKLRDTIVEVANTGKVVRKTQNHVAFEFPQITQAMHNNFQTVIDDYVAAQFANSQL
jgi:hypothetical protein